jgi:ubiquinone/menaquinone biosynthesis methyltransferase
MDQEQVFCGAKKVLIEEKKYFVQNIFSNVCENYNLMNDVMSLGIHHLWKKKFVSLMNQFLIYKKNALILDVASGTGDIAINFLKHNKKHKIILSDINDAMLGKAKDRMIDLNLLEYTDFCIADAANLPFDDNFIDLYTISFGIRNVANLKMALDEAHRVLKPSGYFLCMEFSPNYEEDQCFSKVYNFYLKKIIPLIGEKIAQNREAYQYLVDSINSFPNKETFSDIIRSANFKNVRYISLNFGLVVIHIGQKVHVNEL